MSWDWSAPCQQAFEMLKTRFTEASILRGTDYKRPFELHTDRSGVGLGAVLLQRTEGKSSSLPSIPNVLTILEALGPCDWSLPPSLVQNNALCVAYDHESSPVNLRQL